MSENVCGRCTAFHRYPSPREKFGDCKSYGLTNQQENSPCNHCDPIEATKP